MHRAEERRRQTISALPPVGASVSAGGFFQLTERRHEAVENEEAGLPKQQQDLALQVQEYIERHHPEMSGSEVEISICGTHAAVCTARKSHHEK